MVHSFDKETFLYLNRKFVTADYTKNISEKFAYCFWTGVKRRTMISIVYDGTTEVVMLPIAWEEDQWVYEVLNQKTKESRHGILKRRDLWQVLAGVLSLDEDRIEEVRKINCAVNVAYKMYKIQWVKRKSLDQILNEYEEYFEKIKRKGYNSSIYSFKDHLERYGYHGELYSPFDYFKENELMNREFVRDMVYPNTDLRDAIEKYWMYNGSFDL